MNCVPEELRVHLCDKKITTGYVLAELADEYVITHKRGKDRFDMKSQNDCKLKGVRDREKRVNGRIKEENRNIPRRGDKTRTCYLVDLKCGSTRKLVISVTLNSVGKQQPTSVPCINW